MPATGERLRLHFYFDRMFGGYSTPEGATLDAFDDGELAEVVADPAKAAISDPEIWLDESFALAKDFAYAEPVRTGSAPYVLTRDYETNARNVSRSQAALAAARLANLLNAVLD